MRPVLRHGRGCCRKWRSPPQYRPASGWRFMPWGSLHASVSASREVSSAYCGFAPGDPIHGVYHDTEYGFPTEEESVLFERLMLEINQAGVSWATILEKRAAFGAAYGEF